ncbi:MAG: hypothetical protein F6K62_02480 [Sphaerospermopsis sp. SIO1G2]|nr:hypothetical protein [Sphaerospermopsis sp. SIO1G2]
MDVRSFVEYENTHIPGAIFIPLTDIEDGKGITKIKSIISNKKLITYCSVGIRSNKALELLKNAGVTGTNVQGGINQWREKIDPTMPKL